jgi:hypothetical protein
MTNISHFSKEKILYLRRKKPRYQIITSRGYVLKTTDDVKEVFALVNITRNVEVKIL